MSGQQFGSSVLPQESIYGIRARFLMLMAALEEEYSDGAQFIVSAGVPSGAMTLRTDLGIVHGVCVNKTFTSAADALYFTADAGATWTSIAPQDLLATSSPTFAALTLTGALAAASAALTGALTAVGVTSTGAVTTTNGVTSGAALAVSGRRASSTAAGTALTNSTVETVLASIPLEAGAFKNAGAAMPFKYALKVTANAGTSTLALNLRLTATTLVGTAILALSAIDTAANDIIVIEGVITSYNVAGESANVVASGTYNVAGQQGTAFTIPWVQVATARATNAALLLELSGQWSAADANSVYCVQKWAEGPV